VKRAQVPPAGPGTYRNAALACLILGSAGIAETQEIRSRHDGLSAATSSSTAGAGNIHLSAFGRAFLWDNQAAEKIPPVLPHLELNYGLTDYLDLAAGLNAVSYVFQPGYVYATAKVTTPDNKSIRLAGFSQTVEARRVLADYFPSNGYRVETEGFGPEGFMLGNRDAITLFKFTTAADLEFIRISSYLPFKLYANLGWEGAFSSLINQDNRERVKASKGKLKIPDQDFSMVPMALGLEFKTYATDFFLEAESQPFTRQILGRIGSAFGGRESGEWLRFHVVGKTFDVHYREAPAYLNAGAKLKYASGLQLQGGLSWLLSKDEGPSLGPCNNVSNICREGATDGYSPFHPQWKVFWLVRYPFRFTQPSSELYRAFLLRRYQDKRKKVDLEATLEKPAIDAEQLDARERKKALERRRKEADGKAVDLN
jgi:hypothetical protein